MMPQKSTTLEELSNDILTQILIRLPFPVILQCKTVNKHFLSLISDPSFLSIRQIHYQLKPLAFETHIHFLFFRMVFNFNYKKPIVISVNSNNEVHILKGYEFLLHLPQDNGQVKMKATHQELVLCGTQDMSYTYYFVCNPFTKEYIALPPIRNSEEIQVTAVGFMCDQSRSRFRVAHIPIVHFRYVSSFQVNLFLSETGEWESSNVTFPLARDALMSDICLNSILVYNEKFIWCLRRHGFLVCDPFDDSDSRWRIISMDIPCIFLHGNSDYNLYNGICNGRVKMYVFSKIKSTCDVFELVNLERGKWSFAEHFDSVKINDMKLLASHPHCEYMMYFCSNEGIFLCDYKNHKLEPVCVNAETANMHVSDHVMSIDLPDWPTPMPTLNAAKFN